MSRYSIEIKQQVYEKFLWDHTAKELAEEFSVPLSTVYESGIIRTIPTTKRIGIALSYPGPYSDTVLSRALEVNKTTIFRHRSAAKPSKRQQQEDFLSNGILTVYKKSGCRFGAERIRIQLQKQGICTSKKRIIRLMKKLRLYCTGKQSCYYNAGRYSTMEFPNQC